MNIISPKEFVNTFYKDIFNLLSEKFTKIGIRRPRAFREERAAWRLLTKYIWIIQNFKAELKRYCRRKRTKITHSHKNEQIRQISQEVERTRSELKKVKTGNNKEIDQLKKSRKSRSTSSRKKRDAILEIPVLPEISSDDPKIRESCDLFFYDIPKYWSEEDVRTNLMKIGKVLRIQRWSIWDLYRKTFSQMVQREFKFERMTRKRSMADSERLN
ncbi:hypothetical protein RhiirA4_466278 [Rhizophagus irregularis]|uniref:Uncharacterized protein n=1 Tax=Rhizophagus irregularis TaxID=588596 RepID=A0A2I1GA09_9GLOM|nr:hypothetical protein RhiirA4_457462 [Rhizophagus irregularis]PKY50036.1 hypothetical protein RhiirA4_466278 [Rhizophagus irregularis]